MVRKFAHFRYLVNCSNMLFERTLLHLAVNPQTSNVSHGQVLPSVESVFLCIRYHVKSVWSLDMHDALFASPVPGLVHTGVTVIHNVSRRRQRKEDWVMVIGNVHSEVWTCGSWDKYANSRYICILGMDGYPAPASGYGRFSTNRWNPPPAGLCVARRVGTDRHIYIQM